MSSGQGSSSMSAIMAPPLSFSMISNTTKNKVKFNWKVDKFLEAVQMADKMRNLVKILGVFVSPNGGHITLSSLKDVWFTRNKGKVIVMSLRTCDKTEYICFGVADRRCTTVRNKLRRIVGEIDIIGTVSVTCLQERQCIPLFTEAEVNLNTPVLWNLFKINEIPKFLDGTGALNIEVEFTTHCLRSKKEPQSLQGEDATAATILEDKIRDSLANTLAALLGDERTADINILIMNNEEILHRFFCHSKILSSRSSVFSAMLQSNGMTENEEGIIKISDTSVKSMEQFLRFLYCGDFNDERNPTTGKLVWIESLPELVYLADKYDVKDLLKYCDLHLQRAVAQDNAQILLQVASCHNLKKAEAKIKLILRKET